MMEKIDRGSIVLICNMTELQVSLENRTAKEVITHGALTVKRVYRILPNEKNYN